VSAKRPSAQINERQYFIEKARQIAAEWPDEWGAATIGLDSRCARASRDVFRRAMPDADGLALITAMVGYVLFVREWRSKYGHKIPRSPKPNKSALLREALAALREDSAAFAAIVGIADEADNIVVAPDQPESEPIDAADALELARGAASTRRAVINRMLPRLAFACAPKGRPADPWANGPAAEDAASVITRNCRCSYEQALDLVERIAPAGNDLKRAAHKAKSVRRKKMSST